MIWCSNLSPHSFCPSSPVQRAIDTLSTAYIRRVRETEFMSNALAAIEHPSTASTESSLKLWRLFWCRWPHIPPLSPGPGALFGSNRGWIYLPDAQVLAEHCLCVASRPFSHSSVLYRGARGKKWERD